MLVVSAGKRSRRVRAIVGVLGAALILAQCGSGPILRPITPTAPVSETGNAPGVEPGAPSASLPSPQTPSTSNPSTTPTGDAEPSATASVSPTPLQGETSPRSLQGWTWEEKVGQLFMVGINARAPRNATLEILREHEIGNAFVAGRSSAGLNKTTKLVKRLREHVGGRERGVPPFISTDQEGGLVQVLAGRGFTTIPSAMAQSKMTTAELRAAAAGWGAELAPAGVNLNLAPVMDVVPSAEAAKKNAPIGASDRSFGYGAGLVASHANAFSAGMESAGVDVAIKHFPGLGRVKGNTDTTADVVDTATSASTDSVAAFQSGIDAGARFVMMSSAVYDQLDPTGPAVFSTPVITGLLREEMGFAGVVISDDLASAEQVSAWTPEERALKFIAAGGDMVLVAHTPQIVGPMTAAVVAQAQKDPAFGDLVDEAVLRVLAAKARLR